MYKSMNSIPVNSGIGVIAVYRETPEKQQVLIQQTNTIADVVAVMSELCKDIKAVIRRVIPTSEVGVEMVISNNASYRITIKKVNAPLFEAHIGLEANQTVADIRNKLLVCYVRAELNRRLQKLGYQGTPIEILFQDGHLEAYFGKGKCIAFSPVNMEVHKVIKEILYKISE